VTEAKQVLEQAIERWNAADRDGWAALYADDVVQEAPGGSRISGLADLKEKYFDALLTAAPDRSSRDVLLVAEGDSVFERARYTGTHTGPWRNPDGAEIPQRGSRSTSPSSVSSGSSPAGSARSGSTTTRSRSSPSSD